MAGYDAIVSKLGELETLRGKVYPLSAPESAKPPYAVYEGESQKKRWVIVGDNELIDSEYTINVIASTYSALRVLTEEVVRKLEELEGTSLNGTYYQAVFTECGEEYYNKTTKSYCSVIDTKFIF